MPLLTLVLVASRVDVAFEAYVLAELLPDVIASGRESYCVCTMQVALGFLAAFGAGGERSETEGSTEMTAR